MSIHEIFDNKIKEYIEKCVNNRYILSIEKCCGYGEFITEYKKSTLADLYRSVKMNFEPHGEIKLFVINPSSNVKMELPNDHTVELRQFIIGNPQYFQPIYPLPAKVVYTIYFDDGCHCLSHGHESESCKLANR